LSNHSCFYAPAFSRDALQFWIYHTLCMNVSENFVICSYKKNGCFLKNIHNIYFVPSHVHKKQLCIQIWVLIEVYNLFYWVLYKKGGILRYFLLVIFLYNTSIRPMTLQCFISLTNMQRSKTLHNPWTEWHKDQKITNGLGLNLLVIAVSILGIWSRGNLIIM
jgi:hypothetical protein